MEGRIDGYVDVQMGNAKRNQCVYGKAVDRGR